MLSNASHNKFQIVRLALQSIDVLSVEELCSKLQCHPNTLSKWILEINQELHSEYLTKKGQTIFIKENLFNLYSYYCLLAKDELPLLIFRELIFGRKKHTLLTLSKKLFISRSALYSAIRKINYYYKAYKIEIKISDFIFIKSDILSLINLIYEIQLHNDELTSNRIDYYLYNVVSDLSGYFHIKKDPLTLKYFYMWLQSYIQFKQIEKTYKVEVLDTNNVLKYLDITYMSKDEYITSVLKRLQITYIKDEIHDIDFNILFFGLFFASPKVENISKRYDFFLIQKKIYSHYMDNNNMKKLEKNLLKYFSISNRNKDESDYFINGLQTVLLNNKFFPIRYNEFSFTQNIFDCPASVAKSIKELENWDLIPDYVSEAMLHILWFLFKNTTYTKNSSPLKKKIVFKSSLGNDTDKRLQKLFINQFVDSDDHSDLENTNVLYVVDDDRLLVDSSTISLEKFLSKLNQSL